MTKQSSVVAIPWHTESDEEIEGLRSDLYSELETGHNRSANSSANRKGDEPREDNVPKNRPVNILACTEPPDKYHGADLAVCRADRNSDVRRDKNGQRWTNLDTETAEIKWFESVDIFNK